MDTCPECQREAPLIWTRDGKRCPACSAPLAPSERQMKLFSRGFIGASLAQIILLPTMPLLLLGSFLAALYRQIEGAWRLMPGILAIFLFWILLLPPLLESPKNSSFAIVIAFFLLVAALQWPALSVTRDMVLRGHGLLAGATLASFASALFFSFFATLALFLFLS